MNSRGLTAPKQTHSLPDLCSNQVLLVLLLLAFGLALLIVLSVPDPFAGFWPALGLASLFTVWVTVLVAGCLCALDRLGLLAHRFRWAVVFLVIQAVVLLASGLTVLASRQFSGIELFEPGVADTFIWRNQLIALIASLAFIRYLALHQRWKSQLRAEQGARMASLQARIRPHFLFNTLNTIASLVRTRPDDAEQAVLDLSDLLRSGLRDDSWHTLADELELVRGYLRIESLRLGERLRIDWQLSDTLPLDDELPALLIQPLVENAIVHGISRLPEGGELKIAGRADRGGKWSFAVENPVPEEGEPNGGDGARMALDNIRQRLELAWEGRARLVTKRDDGRFRAELRMPGAG